MGLQYVLHFLTRFQPRTIAISSKQDQLDRESVAQAEARFSLRDDPHTEDPETPTGCAVVIVPEGRLPMALSSGIQHLCGSSVTACSETCRVAPFLYIEINMINLGATKKLAVHCETICLFKAIWGVIRLGSDTRRSETD